MAFQYVIVKNSGRGRGYLPTIMPEASIKSIVDGNMLSVILTETDEEGARIVMEKMHKSLDRITTDISGVRKMLRISPSIGVSTIREEDTDAIEMYERAKEEFVYDKG